MESDNKRIWVGIQGPSGAGKTVLVRELCRRLGAEAVAVPLDHFYRQMPQPLPDDLSTMNFELPELLDWELFARFMDAIEAENRAELPIYNFGTGLRQGAETVGGGRIYLVEGLWAFVHPWLVERLALKAYIDTDPATRMERRLGRDVGQGERAGWRWESARRYFQNTVLPMEKLHVVPGRALADLLLDGLAPIEDNAVKVIENLLHVRDGSR